VTGKKTFVLVHGAWRGGWCYGPLARLLRRHGHEVFTPTLTGLGQRSHLFSPEINLSVHVQDVLNLIKFEQLQDIVLCGHSYGGLVVTGVADSVPEQIRSLVYIDAYIGADRTSLFDLDTPEAVRFFIDAVQSHGGHALPPVPASRFNDRPENQGWIDRLATPQPFASFAERRPLSGAYDTIAGKTYILATDWPGSPFHRQCATIDGKPDWTVHKMHCGHDIMVDHPAELAAILETC
jgi:pimeloyl-ACP methyl ester carboxylesterase